MSYVVQNFYDKSPLLVKSPRILSVLYFNSFDKFAMFLKLNNFWFYLQKSYNFSINYFNVFYRYFFKKNPHKLILTHSYKPFGFYRMNLGISAYSLLLSNFLKLLNNKVFSYKRITGDNLNEYVYLTPVKFLNFWTKMSFSKTTTLLFFFHTHFIWLQYSPDIKFWKNFIATSESYHFLSVYGGYFCKIYNF